jgi:4-alpha-glucanotransferase
VPVSGPLAALAAAHGVATEYEDQLHRTVQVPAESVVAVLGALGVDATSPRAVDDARREVDRRSSLPPVVVLRTGESRQVAVSGPAELQLEDGTARSLAADDGRLMLPAGLPLGWHRLESAAGVLPVVVAPDRLELPAGRHWGLMVQLYAMRSDEAWGVGDLSDLATLGRWTAEQGGGLLLVNPLHAVAPNPPLQPSPYYPASRRWTNPLYLRIEATAAYLDAPTQLRAQVDAMRVRSDGELIDRDASWSAKAAALELLWTHERDRGTVPEHLAHDPREPALRDWATWCALAEQHGNDWRTWPADLRRPDTPAVRQAAVDLAERIRFHTWLQMLCSSQLADAQQSALDAGMPIGVVHDLAVGTDPAGADAWALQDALALGARIGAPPDTFNQQGQDWGMPPWHPRRLADLGYAPLRDMLRAVLAHAGGVRIDHVLGLFRMWWVPADGTARDGTYVSYDADALLGVVTLEAHRARAVVIGEDLGTVTRQVRRELSSRGVLGTSVLWFERESPTDGRRGRLRPPAQWREAATASVTTHDLPTALGWLRGKHVDVRADLGLLDDPAAERESWLADRAEMVAALVAEGLLDPAARENEEEVVRALHRALAQTPCRVVLAAPGDAVGDLRQPNLPGTTDEYPNWRLPVADADGQPMSLGQLLADPRVRRLAADLHNAVR